MALKLTGHVELPPHRTPGGFDHAAVHGPSGRVFVAHTANDDVDVVDGHADRYLYSVHGLGGVAGALVSEETNLVFTSNRGENTVGIFDVDRRELLARVPVGMRPNGLAYCPSRSLLLVAHVGDAAIADSFTVSLVDVKARARIADFPVPGRTRWAVYEAGSDRFYVNIAAPPRIIAIDASDPSRISRILPIPCEGPHGLDLDAENGRLFCACDGGRLVVVDTAHWAVTDQVEIGGVPDVVFYNPVRRHLYVAIGDPGVIEVIDTERLIRHQSVRTERGAHTTALDFHRNRLYVFLPETHRASVWADDPD